MEGRSQVVQIERDARLGIVSLRESQVGRDIDIGIGQFVGGRDTTLHRRLIASPFIEILPDKRDLFHRIELFLRQN